MLWILCLIIVYYYNIYQIQNKIISYDDIIGDNFGFEEYEISNDVLNHKQGNK